ncbi:hypothetical protein [Botrimarina sp.]|uniref:hypothetical protein n=1 Tax=Botrimarina sp. TaxID=2795802 RepID=UPI0032EAEA89
MRSVTCLLMVLSVGCSYGPRAVRPVDVDPDEAAAEAMALYDADSDGSLAGEELLGVPGVVMAMRFYDADTDGRVTQEEIRERIAGWEDQGLGFKPMGVRVTLDGRPVADAEVKLIPEPYLGDAVKPAAGTTLPDGSANVSVKQEDLPAALKQRGRPFYGVTGGTYKIEITGGDTPIDPAKIDPSTPLGVEVAYDTIQTNFHLNLRSRR